MKKEDLKKLIIEKKSIKVRTKTLEEFMKLQKYLFSIEIYWWCDNGTGELEEYRNAFGIGIDYEGSGNITFTYYGSEEGLKEDRAFEIRYQDIIPPKEIILFI